MNKLVKNRGLINFLIIILFSLTYLTSYNTHAYSIFNSSRYTLPAGKDILLWPGKLACNGITWKSKNNDIATVNSYGIVHGKSVGSTEISAYNPKNNKTSVCTVNITQPEPIRSVYISPCIPTEHDNITIYATTPKNSESVKFIITASNYRKEIYAQKYSTNGELCFWKANLSCLKSANYKIETFSKINNVFKSTYTGNIDFKVSNYMDKSKLSNHRRELSRDGANFIIKQEGFVSHVYKDIAGFLAIGYGKSIYPYEAFYNNLNKEEAYQDFLNKVKSSRYECAVNDLLVNNGIQFNQHQFDALVSFTYNLGRSWTINSYLKQLILNCAKQTDPNKIYAKVSSDNGLYLRKEPSTQSAKLAVLHNNEKIIILDENKKNQKWYNVKTLSGKVGYCFGDYITLCDQRVGIKNLNCIDKEEFVREFLFYHHSNRTCIKGLLYRRIKELEIFLNGNYNSRVKLDSYPIPFCIKKLL